MIETRFKDTDVGKIPVDWEVKQLADIGSFSKGCGISRADAITGAIPAVRYGELYTIHDFYIKEFGSFISQAIAQSSRRLRKGDILFTASGETKEDIGKSTAFNQDCDAYAGGDLIILTPRDGYNSIFLGLITNSDKSREQKASKGQGDAVVHISSKEIGNIFIPVPPISEQSRIATALLTIDNLISELGKLIEKKRAIKQGAMQQLLTGKKRLKGFTNLWVEKKLGEIGFLTKQSVNPQSFPEEVFSEYSMPAFDNGKLPESKSGKEMFSNRTVIDGDTLLYNKLNVRQKRIWLIEKCENNSVCSSEFLAFKSNEMNLTFLKFLLSTNKVTQDFIDKSKGTSNSQKRIQPKDFLEYNIFFPNSEKEQSAIASVLSSMDEEISSLEAKRDKYTAIKQGMMQQLLTGKIRLTETAIKTNATSANVHFRRSVLAAEIADRLCEESTFGHVKMEKMLFLTERLCHIDIGSHYHRDAAGPYDNNALRSIDSQLKKQKWFDMQRTEKGNRYVPMQNRGKHKSYFDRYYSGVVPMFDKIINTFKSQRTEQCEIVATLYSAWEDLLRTQKPFTDADIVNEVLNNWHESKKRISKERWLNAIQWMRDNGFVPYITNV